ncbi:MAG: CRISPR-associated endonuclease Cas2 [Cryomorphaceae bacterium]|nr:CRISPR-associated endonuclease Cas2 [Cryomorphaceae bacterium]
MFGVKDKDYNTQVEFRPNKKDRIDKELQRAIKVDDFTQSSSSGLGDFKPDDLSDKEIAEAYTVLAEIKKTLATQKANENKKKKTYQKHKKERLLPAKERADELKFYFESLTKKPRHHMLCFIMYDIENNRIRTKVAKYLEEKGLKRAQKSVFFGELDKRIYNQIHDVLLDIQTAYENTDSLIMVPISEDELKRMRLIGKEVDFEYAIFRGNTLFF